jgi:hypothetical protein
LSSSMAIIRISWNSWSEIVRIIEILLVWFACYHLNQKNVLEALENNF